MSGTEIPITTHLELSGYSVDVTEGPTEDQECLAWASYCACDWNTRFP